MMEKDVVDWWLQVDWLNDTVYIFVYLRMQRSAFDSRLKGEQELRVSKEVSK